VVVGPAGLPVPDGVVRVLEQPPGGGPVAATGAALAVLPADTTLTLLLAADQPFIDAAAVRRLREAFAPAVADGALFADEGGRPQWLCGAWRVGALRDACDRLRADKGGLSGVPLRDLLKGLTATVLDAPAGADRPPPWFDCDTEHDLTMARAWADATDFRDGAARQ
jgi:molybdenum cofactor guanylyltransferase